jgi:hypothetical protein
LVFDDSCFAALPGCGCNFCSHTQSRFKRMGWYVDRVPAKSLEDVLCNRCGGKHFKRDKISGVTCKEKPTVAPSPPRVRVRAVEDGVVGAVEERSLDSIFQASLREPVPVHEKKSQLAPSTRSVSGGPQDALVQEVALLRAKLVKMEALLMAFLSKEAVQSAVFSQDVSVQPLPVLAGLDAAAQCGPVMLSAATQTEDSGVCVAQAQTQTEAFVGVSACAQTDSLQMVPSVDCGTQCVPLVVSGFSQTDDVGAGVEVGVQCGHTATEETQTGAAGVGLDAGMMGSARSQTDEVSGAGQTTVGGGGGGAGADPCGADPWSDVRAPDRGVPRGSARRDLKTKTRKPLGSFHREEPTVLDDYTLLFPCCKDCRESFMFAVEEMQDWHAKGWDYPVRCEECRRARSAARRGAIKDGTDS